MHIDNIKQLEELASARRYVYATFQRFTGDKPSPELLDALDLDVLRMAFEVVGALPGASVQVDELIEQLSAARGNLDRATTDYARVFVGPAALPAPPWESVYRGKKRILMTATTLSVRKYYRAYGYETLCLHNVPDDHVAIELDFLSSLAQEVLDACAVGDMEAARSAFNAGSAFLDAHLGLWLSDFASDLRDRDGSPLYCAIADALAVFVAVDRGLQAGAKSFGKI